MKSVEEAGQLMMQTGAYIGEKTKDVKLNEVAGHVKEGLVTGASVAATELSGVKNKIVAFFNGKKQEERKDNEPPARAQVYKSTDDGA